MPKASSNTTSIADTWDSFDNNDQWEEIGNDNGQQITWDNPGEVHFGIFQRKVTVEIPEEKRNESGDAEADLLVFKNPDTGDNWCCWAGYQLREAFENHDVEPGTLCRIEYTGKRKAKQGEVKLFSVKVRKA